jgi:uncharacterized protein YndB with AHSA1/START domain
MMNKFDNYIANVSVNIDAPVDAVWKALVDPELIQQYMFGTKVGTDWEEGSSIRWKGEWKGKAYEDKGTILEIEPEKVLKYSHFSPLSGQQDVQENYHNVTIKLSGSNGKTTVNLSQDNNENKEERDHSRQNWLMMLEGLRKAVE